MHCQKGFVMTVKPKGASIILCAFYNSNNVRIYSDPPTHHPIEFLELHHNINFQKRNGPSIQVLHWKSVILDIVLLSPNWVPGQPTTVQAASHESVPWHCVYHFKHLHRLWVCTVSCKVLFWQRCKVFLAFRVTLPFPVVVTHSKCLIMYVHIECPRE